MLSRARAWLRRLAGLFGRGRRERDLTAELESHLALHIDDNLRAGMRPEQARRQALIRLGGLEQAKELYRERRGVPWLEQLLADFRFAFRMLGRSRSSAIAIVFLLALGIGGVTTLFSPLYSLVLSPLPYPHSDRIVRIGGESVTFDGYTVEFPHPATLRSIFSFEAAYEPTTDSLSWVMPSPGAPPVWVHAVGVTPQFFPTMGVKPLLGEDLSNEPPANRAAVLSHRFWRTELHGDRNVVGRRLKDALGTIRVVGVMPAGFDYPSGTDLWTPMQGLSGANQQMLGRLRPGLSLDQAAALLKAAGMERGGGLGGNIDNPGPVLETLHDFLLGDRKPLLWTLWSVSLLFLLLACAGAANLLLARAVRRQSEMVVRLTLGAGRARLIRQLLAEALWLAVAGSLLGLGIAAAASRWVLLSLPAARGASSSSFASFGLVVALAVMATVLCALGPAFHATGGNLNAFLKTGTSGITPSTPRHRRFNSHELLSGGQLALATVLLVSTGLLLRSLAAHLRYPLGFDPHNAALVEPGRLPPSPALVAAENRYFRQHHMGFSRGPVVVIRAGAAAKLLEAIRPEQDAQNARNEQFYREAQRRLTRLAGVVSVGVVNPPPFTARWDQLSTMTLSETSQPLPPVPQVRWGIAQVVISPDAFRVLGLRLLAGRAFNAGDVAHAIQEDENAAPGTKKTGVGIINQALAKAFWPRQNPIGKAFSDFTAEETTVIGVVADVHETAENLEITPTFYSPFDPTRGEETFVVRLRPGTALSTFAAGARRALWSLIPGLPPPTVRSLEDLATKSQANLRLALVLLGCFSVLGTIVAALGVYAAATLMAAARTREMGVRMALGADANQIRGLAVWRSLRLILVALPLGALCAWSLAHSLSHWLFQVGVADPPTYALSAALLALVALAAGLVPARRAARINPVVALREE